MRQSDNMLCIVGVGADRRARSRPLRGPNVTGDDETASRKYNTMVLR